MADSTLRGYLKSYVISQQGIDNALSNPTEGPGAALLWAQDSVVVSTFPKL